MFGFSLTSRTYASHTTYRIKKRLLPARLTALEKQPYSRIRNSLVHTLATALMLKACFSLFGWNGFQHWLEIQLKLWLDHTVRLDQTVGDVLGVGGFHQG